MSEINVDLKEDSLSTDEKNAFEEARQQIQNNKPPQPRVTDFTSNNAGFKIPTDFVKLPSGGRVYPVGSALYNLKEVELRYLTAADEDILTSRSLLRSGTALDKVLENCLIDKRIRPDELISGDKNALITFLRVNGYGPKYKVSMNCPSCAEEQLYEFDLSTIQMKELEIEPIAEGVNRFSFQMPSGTDIEFHFLNSRQEKDISDIQEKLKKRTNSPIDRTVTTRLKNLIVSVNGNEDPSFINQYVDTLNVMDSRSLRNYIEKNVPDLDMKGDFSCVHCGHKEEVDIPITVSFFWPDTE